MTEIPKPEFNFPDHIKFKFDWSTHDIGITKLEEDLFVKFDRYIDKSNCFLFYNIDGESHNPYGPSTAWEDGSTFYRIYDRLHRLDGPAFTSFPLRGRNL